MKKMMLAGLVMTAVALAGCVSMNIAGLGNVGDVDLGANVDPINGTVGVDASKTITHGGTSTRIGTSTNGKHVNVDTNVQHRSNEE